MCDSMHGNLVKYQLHIGNGDRLLFPREQKVQECDARNGEKGNKSRAQRIDVFIIGKLV